MTISNNCQSFLMNYNQTISSCYVDGKIVRNQQIKSKTTPFLVNFLFEYKLTNQDITFVKFYSKQLMKIHSNYSFILICAILTVSFTLDTEKPIRRLLSTTETEDTLRAKIDAKIAARAAAVQDYESTLSQIKNIKTSLDQQMPDLIQQRMIAENGYVYYFQNSLKCHGYFPDLDIIGVSREIPADFCQIYPLNLQTYDLVTLRAQNDGYIENTRAAIYAVNSQTDYLADANREQSLYQYLAGLFSLRNNTQLRDKYVTKTNTFATFLALQSQKLQVKKQIQAAAVALDNQYAQIVKQKYAENENNAINCYRNLGTIKTNTLNQYYKAKDIQTQVNYKKSALATAFSNLSLKNSVISGITAELNSLVDQYVALF